jgi:hypothetical protein
MHIQMVIFTCEWMKWKDNWGNLINVWNDTCFLTINFCHKFPLSSKPFIFPSQTIQVFSSNDIKKPSWKIVLWKEIRSSKEVVDTQNVFITTTMEKCS